MTKSIFDKIDKAETDLGNEIVPMLYTVMSGIEVVRATVLAPDYSIALDKIMEIESSPYFLNWIIDKDPIEEDEDDDEDSEDEEDDS